MIKDYIIIGFGLAGLNLAHYLEKRKQSFVVFDPLLNNASRVAGGVTNPLILKRFTKAWKAEQFIPYAESIYKEMEEKLDSHFFNSVPIYRKIKSVEEQNDWFVASDKPELEKFMNHNLQQITQLPSPYSYGEVIQSSFLNTAKLIDLYSQYLIQKDAFSKESVHYNALQFEGDFISYKNTKARKLIFAEGIKALDNPYFKDIHLIGNKGEYLIVKIPNLDLQVIVKTALALVPLGNHYYKFGASYSRDYKDDRPEPEVRKFLLKKLEEMIDLPYTVEDIQVGIRPTVLDRRPLLGKHPDYPNLMICNGFGSHGIMMAPTLAKWLIEDDLNEVPLPQKVNVQRYLKK